MFIRLKASRFIWANDWETKLEKVSRSFCFQRQCPDYLDKPQMALWNYFFTKEIVPAKTIDSSVGYPDSQDVFRQRYKIQNYLQGYLG